MPFGLQPIHIAVIVIVALLIFGPRRLPQIGRWIGKTFSEFRKGAREMADGIRQESAAQEPGGTRAAGPAETPPEASKAPPGDASKAEAGSFAASPYAQAASRYCTSCGAPNAADARFCNKCGNRLPA